MKKNNLISVIINCRNSQKYIKETIDSVINQTYKNFEIIIVNNNSTDNTKNIIFSYSDQRIKYFELNKSISLGAARNISLKESSGEFIAFIDSDDIWDKSKIDLDFWKPVISYEAGKFNLFMLELKSIFLLFK